MHLFAASKKHWTPPQSERMGNSIPANGIYQTPNFKTGHCQNKTTHQTAPNTVIVDGFNTPISLVDSSSGQNLSIETLELNDIIDQMDLTGTSLSHFSIAVVQHYNQGDV